MWLFLWAYSMEFLPKKTQMSLNRPKVILSCRAWKVVFVVKKSAINIVPLGRYRSHNFSWKSRKFVKNQKICKFCGLEFFHIIWSKINSKYIFLFFKSSHIRPGQWKISTRKLEHERADVTLELERTLLTSPWPSPSLTLTLTPSQPHPHTRTLICTLVLKFPRA